jgi:hypothetical protein
MGSTLNAVGFDALYVQFCTCLTSLILSIHLNALRRLDNNVCGLNSFSANQAGQWNFGVWDYWARNVAPNPNVKIFIGAPASVCLCFYLFRGDETLTASPARKCGTGICPYRSIDEHYSEHAFFVPFFRWCNVLGWVSFPP